MNQPTRYNCKEVFERLDDFVDRELDPEELGCVEEHLEKCAACAREYEFEADLLTEIRAKLRRIDVPHDLATRISRMLRESEQGHD